MESVWHDATHSAVFVKMRRIVNIIIIQHRALLSLHKLLVILSSAFTITTVWRISKPMSPTWTLLLGSLVLFSISVTDPHLNIPPEYQAQHTRIKLSPFSPISLNGASILLIS